jgi:hypothetical protein
MVRGADPRRNGSVGLPRLLDYREFSMTAKPKRDERGRFLPGWVNDLCSDFRAYEAETNARLNDLSSRLGTSTPLIIWNIAVLIALAGIAAKVWGYAPY